MLHQITRLQLLSVFMLNLCLRVDAHSWLENLKVVSGSLFASNAPDGYLRNYVGRENPTIDRSTTHLIESITTGLNICKDNQQQPGQQPGLPKLQAYPNDLVLATYLENGHIWKILEHVDPAGAESGTIYWYGTQNPKPDRTVDSVLQWNQDGSGGDGEGILLATTNFDDGTCIEKGQEATTGRKGGPCKSYFRLPKDVEVGKDYTVYWLWDYSMHFGTPDHVEWYSGCMDISILQSASSNQNALSKSHTSHTSVQNSSPPNSGIDHPLSIGTLSPGGGLVQEFGKAKRALNVASAKFRQRYQK